MTEFSIYQINTDRDDNRVCFLGLDTLERLQHSKAVDPALYDRVYDGKLDCNSLEAIYEKFNIDHPADYKGRSLSVSDVVEIRESDTLNPGFYFVDSIGFKSISFDKSLCKEPVEASIGKISVLLVEPNKYPKMIEIDDTLEAMQEVVGGDIEEYMPFEDEVAIICNEEGKVNGLSPNRAVYGEPQAVEMTFAEMRSRFCEAENEGKEHLSGYIVFSQDSFDKPYDERSRTYGVSSNNKAFQSGMGGYSIFGSYLDGTDPCVRLDGYMFGENAWKIEKCYMMEPSREMLDIICGKFFITYEEQREYLAELLKDKNNSLWAAVLYGIRYSEDQIVTVALSQVGNVGGEPYWSWYGFGSRVEWCACFVSWCANECGYIETGVIPKYAGCVNGVQWFKDRGQWIDGSAEPVPGMIIFFDWNNKGSSGPQDGQADHTGIVQKVENGIVYTVEGNSGDSCRVNQYSVGHYEILGYGVPNY